MNDDDEGSWWKSLTMPQTLVIVAVLVVLFGGVQCSFDSHSSSAPTQKGDA